MAHKKYNMLTAIDMIEKNKGRVKDGIITMLEPGLKVLGAIDYLVHNHKHTWITDKPKYN